ncbi:hypothetical protein BV911_17995 [Pseudoruegeria sp. SK021]|nr:hypothetical protein BV911_17995 [Pseudoruegeria sp. SK021]
MIAVMATFGGLLLIGIPVTVGHGILVRVSAWRVFSKGYSAALPRIAPHQILKSFQVSLSLKEILRPGTHPAPKTQKAIHLSRRT